MQEYRKESFWFGNWKSITLLLILIFSLLILVLNFSRILALFSFATVTPAKISVDAAKIQGMLPVPWNGLAQGGELDSNGREIMSLGPTVSKVKDLKTKYIRIDHVFDLPSDGRIKEIIDSGAIPVISLSYFPKGVGTSDVGEVISYDQWQKQVTTLVEKVSGTQGFNVSGVYYEVWNEPDGETFGNFRIGEGKDYFVLYEKTVQAILRAKNVNEFKIGGPALADLRRCANGLLGTCQKYWLDRFLGLVAKNKTRIDFLSWHRYSLKMSDYKDDVNFINSIYSKYSNLPSLEKLITEWGSVPEHNSLHDSYFDAVHLVAAARTFLGQVDLATKFEIRDGPGISSGGWGIMDNGGRPKPTFFALRFLSLLRQQRIVVDGEGTNVTGIASRDNSGFTLILSNYDPESKNFEKVPMKIFNLPKGRYRVSKYILNSSSPTGSSFDPLETDVTMGVFADEQTMAPNSIVLWDLQRILL